MGWKGYRNLSVWEKAMTLADLSYALQEQLPAREDAVLGAQLRRTAVAIPAAIAEGTGRGVQREQYHYLMMARGSVYALETTLLLCVRRGYLREAQAKDALDLCGEVTNMLMSLSLRQTRGVQRRYPDYLTEEGDT